MSCCSCVALPSKPDLLFEDEEDDDDARFSEINAVEIHMPGIFLWEAKVHGRMDVTEGYRNSAIQSKTQIDSQRHLLIIRVGLWAIMVHDTINREHPQYYR